MLIDMAEDVEQMIGTTTSTPHARTQAALKAERLVDTTVSRADEMKLHTAEALAEAARKLREADLGSKGQEVKAIIDDIEARTAELKAEVDKKVEPVETFIVEHPFASVMIAVGIGFMVGSLMTRRD
ncbi:hypothetical protein RCIX861 [Methanocella arvoryzae MRE50]|uniref:DUF883 domain-containing protein n=2 Tax=Methanocella TaxID=570266 RepID=Q0W5W9_METAR|nr:hypothetical protein RCIX861 [Methanocella arvoryzae MRE50]